ncbi:HAD family hydrolase [Uliginosibacterium sp. 31-12]|uniref:HAD family hydrolase n=1 Tax=Uliginosibacterium sp. 31-12 TaxID=3062781 RepID=UPI0026E34230|nr:HAD family hydrolase [Uliginosibacterium sp. 31-12]MDO6387146.1 HAD family hydrolase [Uliginosibacterium sp. 31-12]
MSVSSRGAVFFDLDETLVDRQAGLRQFAAQLWQEGLVRKLGMTEFIEHFILIDDNGRAPGPERFTSLCAEHLPGISPQDLITRIRSEAWRAPQLFPDAVQTLDTLAARGFRVGIVSNGSSISQRAKLHNTALRPWNDVAVISGELGCKKPDAQIYQHAMAMLGVSATESWFIGDCPVNDVLGPAALGMKPIWIERHVSWAPQHAPAYVARVTRLTEVLDVIQ